MMRSLKSALLSAFLGLAACMQGVSPAESQSGGPFSISPEKEAELGREQHPKVLAEFGGAYPDQKVQAFVTGLGNRMKNVTPMAGEEFTFTLLNSDVVNAFALPGGYVYVTRGLLALARDEAEFAGVLGHEIGHVVAHHTAQRYSRSVLGQLAGPVGQVLGGVLGGYLGGEAGAKMGAQALGQGGALAGQAYVQGFSRQQEFEADQLGVGFLRAAGFEPRAMASFLSQLEAQDELQRKKTGNQSTTPSWLQSHPRTPDRIERAAVLAADETPTARETDQDAYYAAINGLLYGDDPSQGFVKGRTFEHPDLGFRFTAPPGFTLQNAPTAVIGKDAQGRLMKFDTSQGQSRSPEGYLTREWVKGGSVEQVDSFTIGRLEAASGFAPIQINQQQADSLVAAIAGPDGLYYRFIFAKIGGQMTRADISAFQDSIQSFERLPQGAASTFQPLRVRIVTARSGDTSESLAKQMDVDELPLETFLMLNGLKPDQQLRAGDPFKVLKRG